MTQRKLRVIKSARPGQQEVKGISIPPKISMFFEDTHFHIEKSGTSIILTSGAIYKEDSDIELDDFKV